MTKVLGNKPGPVIDSEQAAQAAQIQVSAQAPAPSDPLPPPPVNMSTPADTESMLNPDAIKADDTQVILDYDPKTDQYVEKVVPREVAMVTARNMTEASERLGSNALDTSMYDQRLRYFWAPKATDHPSHTAARVKGYAPVRTTDVHMHNKEKVGEMGVCVTFGDMVLMAVPRDTAEYREALENERRREQQQEQINPHIGNIHSAIDKYEGDGKTGITQNDWRVRYEMQGGPGLDSYGDGGGDGDFGSGADRTAMQIDAISRARRNAGMGGPQSFGGFDGPFNNGAIPPSPSMRGR